METLVPTEHLYYERLVGVIGDSSSVPEYIESGLRPFLANLWQWRGSEGFLGALLTCSVAQVASAIDLQDFESEGLAASYEWLVEKGDPISQVGAIEVALSHLDSHPQLAPFVERMVEQLIADDSAAEEGSFALLSALIPMVGGELSAKRVLGNAPPFYRKQCAIAQASLIVRMVSKAGIDAAGVSRWATGLGVGHIFYLQGLVDLRQEPRWLPDFVAADQLRAEVIGRIANVVERHEEKIQTETLRNLVLGPDSELARAVEGPYPYPYLPGPLEGATRRQTAPDEVMQQVKDALEADQLEASSFATLVNTILVFDLPEGQSDLAAVALRRVKFAVQDVEGGSGVWPLVSGLAVVAAVTRGAELADALRVLTRVMRRRERFDDRPDNELRVAMIAAAAFEKREDWAQFLGEWVTEMALEIEDKAAAQRLLIQLDRLARIDPQLNRHSAAAMAALGALVGAMV